MQQVEFSNLQTKKKEIIINAFVYSNFIYCPLTWHFSSKASSIKNGNIQYWSRKLFSNDYGKDYHFLLEKTENFKMEIKRLYTLAFVTFKTLETLYSCT